MRVTVIALTILLFIQFNASGQMYNTGLIFNDVNYQKANIKANLNSKEFNDLPASASLKKYCPKPGNQLQLNTSPAWATSWSARTILNAQKNNWTDQETITNNTYSPAYSYYHIRNAKDETCEAGIDLYEALSLLKYKGVKKYMDFLEFCPRGIPEEIYQSDYNDTMSDFRKLFDENHSNQFKINAVKKSISEKYPVVIGMYCPPSFYTAKNFWQPSEMASTEYPGHALSVIGYDNEKYGGAFEVINSWGNRWGNDGFIWIRYNDFVNFTKYAYEVFNIEKSQEGNYAFSGSINLKLNNSMDVKMEKLKNGIFKTESALSTGTHFRVYLKNETPAFVYVFGIDELNNFFRVFPHLENISPALIYKTNVVAIPGEDNYIEIIGDPGQENLCILYTKEPIDFNGLLINLEKYSGAISENIDALLEGKVINSDAISWQENGIGFHSKSKTKSALLIQIQIDHI